MQDQLINKSRLLSEARSLMEFGTWAFSSDDFSGIWSAEMYDLFHRDPELGVPSMKEFFQYIHPRDWRILLKTFRELKKEGDRATFECRTNPKKGPIRFMQIKCMAVRDEESDSLFFTGCIENITDLRQIGAELSDAKTLNQTILDESPIGILIFGEDGPCIMVNSAIRAFMRANRMQIKHLNFRQLQILRENGLYDLMLQVLQTGETAKKEVHEINIKNEEVWYEAIISRFVYQGKKHIILMASDIMTERKAQEALNREQELLSNLMETIPDRIYFKDLQSRFLRINRAMVRCFGLDNQSGAIGKTDFDFFSDLHADETCRDEQRIIRTGEAIVGKEEEEIWPDGRRNWVSSTKVPLRDGKGETVGIMGISREITDFIRTRELLQTNTRFLNTIIENAAISQWISDEHGVVIKANSACLKLFNITKDEVIGKYCLFEDNEIESKGFMPEIHEVFNEGKTADFIIDYDFSNVTHVDLKHGTHKTLRSIITPVTDENGKVANAIVQTIDLTETKKNEAELLRQKNEIESQIAAYTLLTSEYAETNENLRITNEQLEAARARAEEHSQLKTAFLQNMSHEIRTPMNAIVGFSELLRFHYHNADKLKEYTDIIIQRCKDLLSIIDDILDISRIESGQLPVKLERFHLPSLYSELDLFFKPFREKLGRDGVELVFKYPDDQSLFLLPIESDRGKLKQILINLISNAFKFTESGTITVYGRVLENSILNFQVQDTGIGIPEEKIDFIFERFAQIPTGLTQIHGGTGLGLSIVEGLLQFLKGSIKVNSAPGQGSLFEFSLPVTVTVSPSKKGPDEKAENSSGQISNREDDSTGRDAHVILLVEDDEANAVYLKTILEATGYRILHTASGQEAIKIALREPVAIVFMDIRLPDLDGYQATKLIRMVDEDVVIIAQTAYAMESDRRWALEAGCNDYLSKPVSRDELLAIVERYIQK